MQTDKDKGGLENEGAIAKYYSTVRKSSWFVFFVWDD